MNLYIINDFSLYKSSPTDTHIVEHFIFRERKAVQEEGSRFYCCKEPNSTSRIQDIISSNKQ